MMRKKLTDEISLNFPELFIVGKYVKVRFKNESPCYCLSSRGQKIKNVTKIEQKRLFLRFWFHLLRRFSHKDRFTQ